MADQGSPTAGLRRGNPTAARLVTDGSHLDSPVSAFYDDGVLRILMSEEPLVLRLIGQADLSHRGAIERALRRTEQGVSDVVVDVSELEFVDVGGVRQLIDHAGVLGIDGRWVRIIGARRAVLRILQVCLWPKPANLCVEDASGRNLAGV